jgi:hypothetical protein
VLLSPVLLSPPDTQPIPPNLSRVEDRKTERPIHIRPGASSPLSFLGRSLSSKSCSLSSKNGLELKYPAFHSPLSFIDQ